MNPSFDLLRSPWIPCLRADGTLVELGLRDALAQAHELREIHGESPLVTAALHRLLLAVLHRVFGPDSLGEWGRLWEAGRWDPARLDDYLNRWRDRFDLFHPERPFYQAPDERVKPKPLNRLIHEVASGNNPTLFDHHTEVEGIALSPAQAARVLVTVQAFGLCGTKGPTMQFTDAPWARGVIFLVQGRTLFETLALNLIRPPRDMIGDDPSKDRPAWEMEDPFTPDRAKPYGYLDYLTWQNRRILLLPEGTGGDIIVRKATMAPALRLAPGVLDPMKHYFQDKKRGPLPLLFTAERALWRDSAALFQLRSEGYRPPLAFYWLATLIEEGYLDPSQTRRYLAMGMSSVPGQAKVHFYRSERMPLPLRYLREPALVEGLSEALEMAEGASRQLWGAVRTLATLLLSPEADAQEGRQPDRKELDRLMNQWAVDRFYWSRLELPFRTLVESLPKEEEGALEVWRQVLRQTAWRAFERVADGLSHDPRALKAVVRARGKLAAGLLKVLPES